MKRIVGKNNEKYYGDNITLGLGETLSCFLKNSRAVEPYLDDASIYIMERDEEKKENNEEYFFLVSKKDSIDDMIAVGDIIFAEGRFFVNAAIGVGMYLNDSFLVKGDKVISTYFDNDIPVNNEIPFEEFFKSMDSCEDAKVKTI